MTVAERALVSVSHRTRLRALSEPNSLELLQSTRGSVKALDAVADQLHRGLQRTSVERSSTTA